MSPRNPFESVLLQSASFNDGDHAFAHALKIVVQNKANLNLLRVDEVDQADGDDFPSFKETTRGIRISIRPKTNS